MELRIRLWLPILLSAVAVWILSTMAWVALPHHQLVVSTLDGLLYGAITGALCGWLWPH